MTHATHNPQFEIIFICSILNLVTQDSRGQLPQKKNQFCPRSCLVSALFQHACDYGGNINTTDDVK